MLLAIVLMDTRLKLVILHLKIFFDGFINCNIVAISFRVTTYMVPYVPLLDFSYWSAVCDIYKVVNTLSISYKKMTILLPLKRPYLHYAMPKFSVIFQMLLLMILFATECIFRFSLLFVDDTKWTELSC